MSKMYFLPAVQKHIDMLDSILIVQGSQMTNDDIKHNFRNVEFFIYTKMYKTRGYDKVTFSYHMV